jgi:hypothetical protein
MKWHNPELRMLENIVLKSWRGLVKNGFTDGIMLTQNDKDYHRRPPNEVWTVSQEETFKLKKYNAGDFIAGLQGQKPKYFLMKTPIEDYPDLYDRYMNTIMAACRKLLGNKLGTVYDVGQIVMYPLNIGYNLIRKLFGKPWHHYAWTEIKGKEVCSSRIAGLMRWGIKGGLNWGVQYFWPQDKLKHSADIAPGHFGCSPKLTRVKVL